MKVRPDRREFWRVLNASADTYFTLQLITVEDGKRIPRNLELIALDGAPVAREVSVAPRGEMLVSPGAREEFIVTTPHAGALSQLVSRNYDTGPDGAANSSRVLANIVASNDVTDAEPDDSHSSVETQPWRFTGLTGIQPERIRKLYLSEDREDLRTPGKPAKYFITVDGREPAVFDMNFKQPDITVRQGTVEDWVIENRAKEAHTFHIHQLHFQLIARDGVEVDEPASCATPSNCLTGMARAPRTRA